ncbi:MAG: hypothetical protein BWK74_07770 [Desulfobacteraceae bacterium A6]|nr:MAG: hypothetical protein BWK74_07770 [Desulfobacteraceae bacterium A6]
MNRNSEDSQQLTAGSFNERGNIWDIFQTVTYRHPKIFTGLQRLFSRAGFFLLLLSSTFFTYISKDSLTSEKIAKKLGTGKRATDRLEGEGPASMIIARKKK